MNTKIMFNEILEKIKNGQAIIISVASSGGYHTGGVEHTIEVQEFTEDITQVKDINIADFPKLIELAGHLENVSGGERIWPNGAANLTDDLANEYGKELKLLLEKLDNE